MDHSGIVGTCEGQARQKCGVCFNSLLTSQSPVPIQGCVGCIGWGIVVWMGTEVVVVVALGSDLTPHTCKDPVRIHHPGMITPDAVFITS